MEGGSVLKILFAEDQPEDNEIATREIRKSGLDFVGRRVDTREDFLAALEAFRPDIVISDYMMPTFDGMQALKLSLEFDPSIPFIVLTGSRNEETAVACMKSGASDYVIKSHINRLPYAIREALERARLSLEGKEALRRLEESEELFRVLFEASPIGKTLTRFDGTIIMANRALAEIIGCTVEELTGTDGGAFIHPEELALRARIIEELLAGRSQSRRVEMRLVRKDGAPVWTDISTVLVRDRGGVPRYLISSLADISGLKREEAQLRALNGELERRIGEKETLLRELFHRTRNNMQVIISLLGWEAELVGSDVVDEFVRKTNDRIMSMSLVHKKLYDSMDLSRIDLNEYCRELIDLLVDSEPGRRRHIRFQPAAEALPVKIDTAVPFGLAFHEIVSNALRHAYPPGAEGEVRVVLSSLVPDRVELAVSDDGVGLPADFDGRSGKTLGFQLIHGLVEGQMGGSFACETGRGLRCIVRFSDAQTQTRV